MKKILLITVLVGLFALVNGSVYAGQWSVTDSSPGSPSHHADAIEDFMASKNVQINVNTDGQSYAASAGHKSGDKAYGVASNSSVVKWISKKKGNEWDDSNSPTASDASAFIKDWNTM